MRGKGSRARSAGVREGLPSTFCRRVSVCSRPVLWPACSCVDQIAGGYMLRLMPGLVAMCGFEALRRFLQVQLVVRPVMYAAGVVSVLHPLWTWLLVHHLDLGVHGAAIATSVSQCLLLGTLLTYVVVVRPHAPGTWCGLQPRAAVAQLREFVKLAVPGAAMTCVEVRVYHVCEWLGWLAAVCRFPVCVLLVCDSKLYGSCAPELSVCHCACDCVTA